MMMPIVWMTNNSIKDYLTQTQQLFGDHLILSNIDYCVLGDGNLDSKILFIKESLDNNILDKEEKKLFSNILKALNLSLDDIFLISTLDKSNTKFSSFYDKIEPLVIVVFGSFISDFFLKNIYKKANIISTYSLTEMINDSNCKKYVWKDLKPILTMLK